jgi:hypothetical protein
MLSPPEYLDSFDSAVKRCEEAFEPLAQFTLHAKIEFGIAINTHLETADYTAPDDDPSQGEVLLSGMITLLPEKMLKLRVHDRRTALACANSAMRIVNDKDCLLSQRKAAYKLFSFAFRLS